MEIKETVFGQYYIIKDREEWILLSNDGKEVSPPTKGTIPLKHQFPSRADAERVLEIYQRGLVDADIAAGKIPDVLADNLERREELHNKDGSYKSIAICLSTAATKPEYESFGTANLCIVGTQIVTELMEITPKDLRMLARMFLEFADRIDQLAEEQAP